MKNYTEELRNEYPYLQDIEMIQELDNHSNQTIIVSSNLPIKLINVLMNLSKGNNRCMMVSFDMVGNRVTFYSDSINNMRPLLSTLKKYY